MSVDNMENNETPKPQIKSSSPQLVKVACENSRLNNAQHKSNTVVITGGPNVILADFGPEPQILKCPYCYNFISTRVRSAATTKTHLWAVLLCMCCCWLCSCCPYLIDSCQDRNHYCSHCNAYLGSYRT
ncbi:hypothetical protein ILUMI_09087 [Ignelater luminosus]|uniref:LITAF domain-containing protein n=1 Tax=Ignelater luminosus TaxID=2038154 RepID=A0A8K0GCS6_IGNLU|nr:hypothetical protein ILUMI_09087 [Ignelater luminosus]